MKFEHLLQLYWTKGFLFGGKLLLFNLNKTQLLISAAGINYFFYLNLIKRFELNNFYLNSNLPYNMLESDELKIINMFFARIMSVNNNIFDWNKLTLIRIYLIKTYKGRCHAIGKPVHGQRTWSNAWTSYNINKTIRLFINKSLKKKNIEQKAINFHKIEKKQKKHKKKKILIPIKNKIFIKKKNINFWV